MDREAQLDGPLAEAKAFYDKIGEADALLISYAEHNASYTAAYKNLFDWTSRIDMNVFQGKPMVMLATSPGPGGARNVLATATTSAPYFGGEVKAELSIPRFYDVFDTEKNVFKDPDTAAQLQQAIDTLNAER
ncbi:2-hydroxy-1,4-benzoquinone reductase [BD1-7 clade bacterium]|uniref:2-hydroxy-1,4-benzoquinone reductase n=1 Tax=BD1-7 clade bacterium TaxID=2029982 RepID=A0A5S9PGZ9_9GAMM|nr:2-hydroxy-1,4-benzoquinone reductase [BD1-7 clade bacterium]CAA0103459.1 2-hydroxy-1,4-benzoquinone reductase [BD1-7 clade bacterium]